VAGQRRDDSAVPRSPFDDACTVDRRTRAMNRHVVLGRWRPRRPARTGCRTAGRP